MLRMFVSGREYAGLNEKTATYKQLCDILITGECRGKNKKKVTSVLRMLDIVYDIVSEGKSFAIVISDEEFLRDRNAFL